MNAYIDASVFLRRLLKQPGNFPDLAHFQSLISSRLIRIEVARSLERSRLRGEFDDAEYVELISSTRDLMRTIRQAPLTSFVLDRAASSFRTPVGSLDAIHLATALLWAEMGGEPIILLTHDNELAIAAKASGLDVKTSP